MGFLFSLLLSSILFFTGINFCCAMENHSGNEDNSSWIDRLEDVLSSIYSKNSPAVVRIESCSKSTVTDLDGKRCTRLGSGFIVDPKGYIITTADVTQEAEKIKIFLYDDTCYTGKIKGIDEKLNISLIKIDAENLPVVEFGSSMDMCPGKTVVSINNPYGLTNSMSIGFISGKCRGGFKTGQVENYIQTTIPLNPGDIGSPLFNHDGEVIGIMTAVLVDDNSDFKQKHNFFQPLGISFAIPIDFIRDNIPDFIRSGRINHGWLGVEVQNISTEEASRMKLTDFKNGILVNHVFPKGPAYTAGVTAGDIITRFGPYEIFDITDLQIAIAQTNIDEEKKLIIIRKNKEYTITIKIEKMPETIDEEKN